MTQYKFEENADVVKRIRWGAYQPEDVEDNFYLWKINHTNVVSIEAASIQEVTSRDGKEKKNKLTLILKLEDGMEVQCFAPARLETSLGHNPNWKKEHKAKEGDIVKIKYLGKDKSAEGNPHTFDVQFAQK